MLNESISVESAIIFYQLAVAMMQGAGGEAFDEYSNTLILTFLKVLSAENILALRLFKK